MFTRHPGEREEEQVSPPVKQRRRRVPLRTCPGHRTPASPPPTPPCWEGSPLHPSEWPWVIFWVGSSCPCRPLLCHWSHAIKRNELTCRPGPRLCQNELHLADWSPGNHLAPPRQHHQARNSKGQGGSVFQKLLRLIFPLPPPPWDFYNSVLPAI